MVFTDLKLNSFPCPLLDGALRVCIMLCVIKNCLDDLYMNNLESSRDRLFFSQRCPDICRLSCEIMRITDNNKKHTHTFWEEAGRNPCTGRSWSGFEPETFLLWHNRANLWNTLVIFSKPPRSNVYIFYVYISCFFF